MTTENKYGNELSDSEIVFELFGWFINEMEREKNMKRNFDSDWEGYGFTSERLSAVLIRASGNACDNEDCEECGA